MPPTLLSGEALPGLNQSLWPLVLWAPTTVPLHLGWWGHEAHEKRVEAASGKHVALIIPGGGWLLLITLNRCRGQRERSDQGQTVGWGRPGRGRICRVLSGQTL